MNPLTFAQALRRRRAGWAKGQPVKAEQLQASFDTEPPRRNVRRPRLWRVAPILADPQALTPAERRALVARLDRLTARFAYAVIAATVILFVAQGARYLIQSGALS
ncbi:MAG: hypothetical protein WC803_08925 [Sphingomonas sp.]|jgi:hypothetical protein